MDKKAKKWFVSRQSYWGVDDPLVVEIAEGGLDYANPDMLSDPHRIYSRLGCDSEYGDSREALRVALAVRRTWEKENWNNMHYVKPRIELACTYGNTIPYEEYPSALDLYKWAHEEYEKQPKCSWCGESATWRPRSVWPRL